MLLRVASFLLRPTPVLYIKFNFEAGIYTPLDMFRIEII